MAAETILAQPFNVNTSSREEVRQFYNLVYRVSSGVPVGWTGSINGCNAGTISQAYLGATLLRVNFYRALAGVPSGIVLSNLFNTRAQAASLIMSANNQLNHAPPANWSCYSADGADGAGHGNLSAGNTGPDSIDGQMGDAGGSNTATGHRRWVLYAPTLVMGSGSVPSSTLTGTNYFAASSLYVFGGPTAAPRPATRDPFVCWPPKGFIPYPLVFHRWNFSFPGADFSGANVALQRSGANVPVLVQSRTENGFGDNTIVWVPDNLDPAAGDLWSKPAADDVWTVTVSNVITNGTAGSFSYNVTIFDPAVAGADYHSAVVTGADQPVVNQNNAYNFTAVANATAYQWRSSKLLALTLTDGAEAGMVNFTAVNDPGYTPITTALHASGNSSFHLSMAFGFVQQTLTFNRTLEATATSQITFQSRLELAASLEARLEVSNDGGATWTSALTQVGAAIREGAFSLKTVNLAAYAGTKIQVRFNLAYVGGGVFNCCDPLGWYIDDINFSNFFDVLSPVITNVPGGLSFNFFPTEQADFELDVRPQFYSQYFANWGPAKHVSTITASAPNITSNPQPQTVTVGGSANFSVIATGSAPLAFQWRFNGANLANGVGISGAQTSALALQNVQLVQGGNYDVIVTNSLGRQTSSPALLTVTAGLSLSGALNSTGLVWSTSGNANWYPQTTNTHDGVAAAQSGDVNDDQSSSLQTSVAGPGTLSFWWQTSSEQDYDLLTFAVDGVNQFTNTGVSAWSQKSLPIAAGSHTLLWKYEKDFSLSVGSDAGWVDEVIYATSASSPPPLDFARLASGMKLLWPNTATNFVLQFATLVTDTNWQTVPANTISNEPGHFYLNVNTATGSRFYRLAAP